MRVRWLVPRLALLLGSLVVAFAAAELILTLLAPRQYIVPAADWTPEYGCIPYPDTRIHNARPGHYHYVYTTNRLRYRGPLVDPASPGRKVVLLGDSNVFGFGVQDHQTIDAHWNRLFQDGTVAINLGSGGWSLAQEVRRYLELGEAFRPFAVVLYFAYNDLLDPVYGISWVAGVGSQGEIRLRDCPANPAGRLRTMLSPETRLYRLLFRSQVFMRIKTLVNRHAMKLAPSVTARPDGTAVNPGTAPSRSAGIPSEQVIVMDYQENDRRYVRLLEAFARRLKQQGVRFVFLSDDREFAGAKLLPQAVRRLEEEGWLEYRAVHDWFVPGEGHASSPQGHLWGPTATRELAERLHSLLTQEVPS